jgi:transcriptional regulator with XRE-family HTH domain
MAKTIRSRPYKVLLEQLIGARKRAGLTQQEVAERLGKSQSFVAKCENGERRIDVVEFIQITDVLGSNPASIINRMKKA